jgi:hypothetical protein
MKQIQLSVPDGKRVEWQEVDGKTIAVLVDEEVKDERPVTERIKTFEDACVALNKRAEAGDETAGDLLADYESNRDNILCKEMLACMKLFIIVAALNEGWEPKFEKDEYRYYPWFRLYTKDEYEELSEEEKGRAVNRSGNNTNANYGVVYVYAFGASSYSSTFIGARLAFRTRELALYAGEQFAEEFADFLFKPRDNEDSE